MTESEATPTAETGEVGAEIMGILGYSCETQAPNSQPTTEYITDRWMKPRRDALIEMVERIVAEHTAEPSEPTLSEALDAYRSWRDEGQRLHDALLTIWRALDPAGRKHMTFGDAPDRVVREVLDALDRPDGRPTLADHTTEEAHCPTCTCGCTCGYGGMHEPENPRCDLHIRPGAEADDA